MSPLRPHDRLREIDAEITALDARLLEEEREAHGIADGQDERAYERLEARAFITRALITMKLREHRELARELLVERCPIHGDARLVSCAECVEASPELAPYRAAYLEAVRAAEANGR